MVSPDKQRLLLFKAQTLNYDVHQQRSHERLKECDGNVNAHWNGSFSPQYSIGETFFDGLKAFRDKSKARVLLRGTPTVILIQWWFLLVGLDTS